MKDISELISQTEAEPLLEDISGERQAALNAAARYAGFRPRSEKELRDKLAEKEFSGEAIDFVIEKYKENRYIDDIGYAELYIKSVSGKYGERRIRDALKRRGVSADNINAAYERAREPEDGDCAGAETETARAAVVKRYGGIPEDFKERQRAKGFLVRRGFSFEVADKALRAEY